MIMRGGIHPLEVIYLTNILNLFFAPNVTMQSLLPQNSSIRIIIFLNILRWILHLNHVQLLSDRIRLFKKIFRIRKLLACLQKENKWFISANRKCSQQIENFLCFTDSYSWWFIGFLLRTLLYRKFFFIVINRKSQFDANGIIQGMKLIRIFRRKIKLKHTETSMTHASRV